MRYMFEQCVIFWGEGGTMRLTARDMRLSARDMRLSAR